MKLGLKYQEAGFGSNNLSPINNGSWALSSNFPSDLGKIMKCAGIPEDDGTSIALGYKFIPEGMLIMLAKRVSMRGRVSRGFQALWIFIPELCEISADRISEIIEKTSLIFNSPLNFASDAKFEKAAGDLFQTEYSSSPSSFIGGGDMKGGELAILMCVAPLTVEEIFRRGFQTQFNNYGLIVINKTGINSTPVTTIELGTGTAQEASHTSSVDTNSKTPAAASAGLPDDGEISGKEETKVKRVVKKVKVVDPVTGEVTIKKVVKKVKAKQPIDATQAPPMEIPMPPPIPGAPSLPPVSQAPSPLSYSDFQPVNSENDSPGIPPPFQPTMPEPTYGEEKRSKTPVIIIAIAACLLILGGIFWWIYYEPGNSDRDAARSYPIVNQYIRSSKTVGGDFNKVASVPYGAEIIIYEDDGEWAKVKYIPEGRNSKPIEGYMVSDYLLDKQDIHLLNSIFGDEESREELSNSWVRRGLLEYYQDHDITGKIDSSTARKVGLETSPYDQWQVFLHRGTTKPNEILFKNAYNPYADHKDLAVIIENVASGKKKLLYFTYDDDETPHLRLSTDYYSSGIRNFYVNSSYYSKQLNVEDQYGKVQSYYIN